VEWNKKIEAERVRELELDRLDLSGSDLAELPVSLYTGLEAQRNLGRLVLLDLSHNRIRTIHGRRMIYWMGSLQKLDCSNNEFTDLPVSGSLPGFVSWLTTAATADRVGGAQQHSSHEL